MTKQMTIVVIGSLRVNHEIMSMVFLSLLLIQEVQLLEEVCTQSIRLTLVMLNP